MSKTYEVGDEIALGDEHFYVISDNGNTVSALARYNITYDLIPLQKEGLTNNIYFASYNYWIENRTLLKEYGENFPAYVYDEKSNLYPYIQNYQAYLVSLGYKSVQATLMSYEQAIMLGCTGGYGEKRSCENAPNWVYSISYWLGSTPNFDQMWMIYDSNLSYVTFSVDKYNGIRPVITINKTEL